MRLKILVAVLLLSLIAVPITVAVQQTVKSPRILLSKTGQNCDFQVLGDSVEPNDPGCGGGGHGVI